MLSPRCPELQCRKRCSTFPRLFTHFAKIHLVNEPETQSVVPALSSLRSLIALESSSTSESPGASTFNFQPQNFTCTFCHKSYNSRKNLTIHLSRSHQHKLCFFSTSCFESFPTDDAAIIKHGQQAHDLTLTRSFQLYQQNKRHTVYKCKFPNCCKRFVDSEALRYHVRSHGQIKPFKCNWPDCGKLYQTTSSAIVHIRTKHQDQMEGNQKPREFIAINHLYVHKEGTSKKELVPAEDSDELFDYFNEFKAIRCSVCNDLVANRKALFRHCAATHERLLCHYASKCRRAFSTAEELLVHGRDDHYHTNVVTDLKKSDRIDDSTTCNFCGKEFANNEHCRIHERRHTDAKPYKCKLCQKQTSNEEVMKDHVRALHILLKSPHGKDVTTHYTTDHRFLHMEQAWRQSFNGPDSMDAKSSDPSSSSNSSEQQNSTTSTSQSAAAATHQTARQIAGNRVNFASVDELSTPSCSSNMPQRVYSPLQVIIPPNSCSLPNTCPRRHFISQDDMARNYYRETMLQMGHMPIIQPPNPTCSLVPINPANLQQSQLALRPIMPPQGPFQYPNPTHPYFNHANDAPFPNPHLASLKLMYLRYFGQNIQSMQVQNGLL